MAPEDGPERWRCGARRRFDAIRQRAGQRDALSGGPRRYDIAIIAE